MDDPAGPEKPPLGADAPVVDDSDVDELVADTLGADI